MRSNGIKREVSPVSQLFLLREKTPESVLVEIVTKSPTVLTYAKLMMHQVDSIYYQVYCKHTNVYLERLLLMCCVSTNENKNTSVFLVW